MLLLILSNDVEGNNENVLVVPDDIPDGGVTIDGPTNLTIRFH